MCTQLAALSMAGGIEAAGNVQAVAGGLDALGDLAGGVTRARMQRQDARSERAYGQSKAGRIRQAGEAELGAARASAAASGVKVGSGSVLMAEKQIVQNVEQDALSSILTGNNRAASLDESARYHQTAGFNSAADGLFELGRNWKRTRRGPTGGGGGYIPQAGE